MTDDNTRMARLKARAQALKTDVYALYLAFRDPQTPWYAKAVAGLTLAMALSPIDLIPDFIPVLGYLDDLIIVPLGISLSVKLIPQDVMTRCRKQASTQMAEDPSLARTGTIIIASVWLILLVLMLWLILKN